MKKQSKKVKQMKKLAAGILSMLLSVGLFSGNFCTEVQGATSPCSIRQELSASSCRQGDTVVLTVYLQGDEESWNISSLEGVLEYDTSLFTLEKADILPVQSSYVSQKSFDTSSGVFRVTYDSDIMVYNKAQVVQLLLHVNEKATTGKTTVCVTNLAWQAEDGTGKNEVEHRVPSSIKISAAESSKTDQPEEEKPGLAGDVNLDGKVTLTDVKVIMQYCNKAKKLNTKQKRNADVNGDGKVNLTDAKLVMKTYNQASAQKPQTKNTNKSTNKKSITISLDKNHPSEKYDFTFKKGAKVKVTVKVLDVSGTGNNKPICFAYIGTNEGKGSLFYDLKTSNLKKNRSFVSKELVDCPCEWGYVEYELPKGLNKLKIKVTFSTVGGGKMIKSLKKSK